MSDLRKMVEETLLSLPPEKLAEIKDDMAFRRQTIVWNVDDARVDLSGLTWGEFKIRGLAEVHEMLRNNREANEPVIVEKKR